MKIKSKINIVVTNNLPNNRDIVIEVLTTEPKFVEVITRKLAETIKELSNLNWLEKKMKGEKYAN